MNIYDLMSRYGLIKGANESTKDLSTHDGGIDNYASYGRTTRGQLNSLHLNGIDLPSILSDLTTGVVGGGINIQSRSSIEGVNEAFEKILAKHSKKENFHSREILSANSFWSKVIVFNALHGGCIIHHRVSKRWDFPYKMDIIGVDMIDISKNNINGRLKNGIQKNVDGAITHLHLFIDEFKTKSLPYSMKNLYYFFDPTFALDQYSPISRLVSIMPSIDNMEVYKDTSIRSAIEAVKAGHYWHTDLFDIITDQIKKELASGAITTDQAQDIMIELGKRGIMPHGATPIPKDDLITEIDTKTDSVFEPLVKDSKMGIASAVGGSPVGVYKNAENLSYATTKALLAYDEESYKSIFLMLKALIDDYLERVFLMGVQEGLIPIPLNEYLKDRDSYHNWDILRTSKATLDESKEASANAKNLENGVTTLNKIYAEKGLDLEEEAMKQTDIDIRIELAKREKYKKAGLDYPIKEI